MFAAEARGELKPGTAREWAHHTKDIKGLPERVGDKDMEDTAKKAGILDALEKFAAFTPAFIRTIARDSDIEVDQPEFKAKCQGLTGEAHLDKMSSGQLGQVAKMIWSKEASAKKEPHKPTKSHKQAPKAPAKAAKPSHDKPVKTEGPSWSDVPKPVQTALQLVGGVTAGHMGGRAAHRASMAVASLPDPGGKDFSKAENFKKLTKEMAAPSTKLDKGTLPGDAYMRHPANRPRDYSIGLGRGATEATAAHELGHRKNYEFLDNLLGGHGKTQAGRDRRLAGILIPGMSRSLTTQPVLRRAAMMGAALGDEPSWIPGGVAAAVATPMLLDEAAASLHALKHLIGKHGVATGMRKAVPLAGAFGTYGAVSLAPLGLTAARKAWRRFHPDEKPESGV